MSPPPSEPDGGGRERGFALLIVLWTVVLLALLVTHLTSTGRGEAQLAANLRLAAVMEAAADGGIAEAIFHALDSSDRHWRADGAPHLVRYPGAIVEVRIDNEAGKINPGTAQPELLEALMHTLGVDTRMAATIAGSITDWRFPDAQGRDGVPKAQPYRDAGRDYAPPGSPFQSLEELGLVLGMTPAIMARLSPYLSVFHDGEPDPRLAGAPVLQAIREATGTAPSAGSGPVSEMVVTITAAAAGPDRGRFVRRAVVRIGARARGGLYQILTWETVDG